MEGSSSEEDIQITGIDISGLLSQLREQARGGHDFARRRNLPAGLARTGL